MFRNLSDVELLEQHRRMKEWIRRLVSDVNGTITNGEDWRMDKLDEEVARRGLEPLPDPYDSL